MKLEQTLLIFVTFGKTVFQTLCLGEADYPKELFRSGSEESEENRVRQKGACISIL